MTTGYPSMSSHSTHPSLDGFHHPHHHPHLPPHLQPAHPHGGQTCVPSLIPPGVDPATVDIRTFYPYQPNEVKHRKRTTRPQLKVLEGVYEHDTKPNALLRKKLAEELGMTPRGVQVWFQNRRAKEKNQAKKLDAGVSATGNVGSGSSSTSAAGSSPSKADGTTTSEGESSTASASKVGSPENAAADVHNSSSPEIPSTSSSAETVRRTSLPTVPVIPALDSASLADGSSAVTSANDISSPGAPGSSYPAAHMVRGSNPSAAEILAQRRPSLPILNYTSSSSHGLRHVPSNLSGRVPKGFNPNERRKSVDTMSANMQRLSTHPYARQAAQYTNASGHGHSGFVYPHGLNARRSISQSAGLSSVEDGPEDGAFAAFTAQQAANGRSYYLSPAQARGQNQSRPMLTQRTSMPSFHQSQQQLSPPSAATNGSFAGQPFTDPWGSPSQSQQSAPSAVDTPISPHTHALPPPSPGASAPPPISQSYSNPMLTHSLSRRYPPPAAHGRPIPAPVPGPLPDAHFSFGLPASGPSSNGSSSSTSPVANDNGLGLMSRGSVVLEEEDDASAVSSTYDPTSRFGSFASVASTESWTSAHYSDIDRRKLSISAPDGFDDQRRGSIASGYLPQLFGEMDVNSGNTPQPMSDGVAPDQSHPDPTRRGSSGSGSLHESQEYSDAYAPQDVYDPSLQHDQYAPNDQSPYTQTPPQTEPYVADNGSYSPSSTISARSQSVAGAKGINEHTHSVSPPMPQRSSTSELMYALHHSNPAENLNNNSELSYPTEYNTSLSNPSDHHLSAHHVHTQYDQLSAKPDQYNSHQYSQQTDTYEMPQSHMQPAYSPPSMEYGYQMYQDPSLYHNGAVEIGSVCVPASMDSMNMGDYLAP